MVQGSMRFTIQEIQPQGLAAPSEATPATLCCELHSYNSLSWNLPTSQTSRARVKENGTSISFDSITIS